MSATNSIMEEGVAVEAMDASTAHDCCDDADAPAMSGKVCKMGYECHCVGLYLPFAPAIYSHGPVVADRFSPFKSFIHALTPAGVWRPPIQLSDS